MGKFKNGAEVRVINGGRTYSTYGAFILDYAEKQKDRWKKYWSAPDGTVGKVVSQGRHGGFDDYLYVVEDSDGVFIIGESGLELVIRPKILITTDGTTTLARLYEGNKVIKTAEAKCHPDDVFEFLEEGAPRAFDRLAGRVPVEQTKPNENTTQEPIKLYCVKDDPGYLTKGKVYEFDGHQVNYDNGNECYYFSSFENWKKGDPTIAARLVPLVERDAKVGEWVYIIDKITDMNNTYADGDVCQVLKENTNGVYIKTLTGKTHGANIGVGTAYIYHFEYLVLDGYHPEPEPKLYNGKVVCVDNDGDAGLTEGKVYKVEDGVMCWNNGEPMAWQFESLDDINRIFRYVATHTHARFIEFKGE